MRNRGEMVTCDRCGKQLFLKYLGEGDVDGGYTTFSKYEELPKTWLYESQLGNLCDKCAAEFRNWVTDFMNGKVCWGWNKRYAEVKDNDRQTTSN